MIKAIIFDLWNTLVYNEKVNPYNLVFSKLGMEENSNNERIVEEALMVGKGDFRLMVLGLLRKLGIGNESLAVELEDAWKESRMLLFPEVIGRLKEFRKKYKIGILTNTTVMDLPQIKKLGIMKFIDYSGFSFETGLLKPDSRAFEDVLENLEVSPHEAVMVGDKIRDDILPAEKLGMKAVLLVRKGEFDRSHVEKGEYKNKISSLDELKKFL